jgi:hypothetical protein
MHWKLQSSVYNAYRYVGYYLKKNLWWHCQIFVKRRMCSSHSVMVVSRCHILFLKNCYFCRLARMCNGRFWMPYFIP